MIKNIIFDVGNVLFEYRWIEAIMDTGLSREEAIEAGHKIFDDTPLWVQFDAGNIELDELIEKYGEYFPDIKENIAEFITHAERMPIPRTEVWDKIHALKLAGYRIYLLSNYSEYLFNIHTKGASFIDDLDGRLVSYEVHQVKPDREIYEALLKKYNLNAEESIFLDDRAENIEAGEKFGIRGIVVESRDHINSILQKMIDDGTK